MLLAREAGSAAAAQYEIAGKMSCFLVLSLFSNRWPSRSFQYSKTFFFMALNHGPFFTQDYRVLLYKWKPIVYYPIYLEFAKTTNFMNF